MHVSPPPMNRGNRPRKTPLAGPPPHCPADLEDGALVETKLPWLRTEGRGSSSDPPPTILPTMISYSGGGRTATEPSRLAPALHFQRARNTYSTRRLPLEEIFRQTFWP